MKISNWLRENIFFVSTLFLLAFIPLYPKLPIINIQHTWVYVRLEDFAVASVILLWIISFLRKKVTLKTPITLPLMVFWIIGGLATLHGVLLIFPTISNVFSNVAFLSYLRRIEYMFLFFIAYSSLKDKKFISYTAITLVFVLLAVVGYGFGQKLFGFPAYLTMNEEFAKGTPIQLSQLSRVPSTFAGQYDLAAYLVLIIPLLVSMVFGFRNKVLKSLFLAGSLFGFVLLFMTVSRVSFFVLLLSLVILLIMQKKRLLIVSLLLITLVFLGFFPSLLQRFGKTVSEVDVLLDAKTGNAIGQVKEVPASYFEDKVVMRQLVADSTNTQFASTSAILPLALIPPHAQLVVEPNSPNGENLPQGTSYINLPLSPVIKKTGQYFFQKSQERTKTNMAEVDVVYGDFVVKRAKAYDLSFTTRFQGEWPRTIESFERNIFLGSGYGSVSLAVDNDYLRLLGESGLFGLFSFFSIFIISGIYIKKILPTVESPIIKSFILGFIAGTLGLALNAALIDVFEASKIAFVFWLLMGITLGVLKLYDQKEVDLYQEFKKTITSSYAIIIYLFVATFVLFSSITSNYFVGDDYTWFRWVADCDGCQTATRVIRYFTETNGFFYRPGTKLYFDFMYQTFWLNQTIYHLVSIFLDFSVAAVLFLIAKRILRSDFLAAVSAILFVMLSGHAEAVLWTASTGHLFNALFIALSLLFFIYWKETKKRKFFITSIIFIVLSLLFHELGVIAPLLLIVYDVVFCEKIIENAYSKKGDYLILLSPLVPYFFIRLFAHSHWFNGDYSYNILKLPFNIIGNLIGYVSLALFGPASLAIYGKLRIFSKDHTFIAIIGSVVIFFVCLFLYRFAANKIKGDERKIAIFGFLFFFISLIPFIGLGNISSRYLYLSSFGFILLFVLLLKNTYEYLLSNGKSIAIASITVITIIFLAAQLFQLQKIQTDWNEAGEKSRQFLISLDWIYGHYSREDISNIYFINVPIRNGEAWVFPVGLKDAVWLVFRDNTIKTYQAQSVQQAFAERGSSSGMVFKFDNDGSLIEMRKTQNGSIIEIKQQN